MALDVQAICLDTMASTLLARSAFAAAVKPGNIIVTSEQGWDARLALRKSPADFPFAFLYPTGGSQPTQVKTFGTGSPVTTLDYGVPMTVTFDLQLVVASDQDSLSFPVEAECRAAIQSLLIALRTAGNRWAGGVTNPRQTRQKKKVNGGLRNVVTYSVSVECRPKLSQLIAS